MADFNDLDLNAGHDILHFIGKLSAPIWFLVSFVEFAGAAKMPAGESIVTHIIDAIPGTMAAVVGVLHCYSLWAYRQGKLKNEILIAKLELGYKCRDFCK